MAQLRKMLGRADSPHILSLMRLIETQSKETLANWCIEYVCRHVLPIYEKKYPQDLRPRRALEAAQVWLAGRVKFPEVRARVLEAHEAARQAVDAPAAQAAARTAGQAAAVVHAPTHSLGLAFYGAAAIVYDRDGLSKTAEEYECLAAQECARMEAALRAMAVENEPNPAKINWNC